MNKFINAIITSFFIIFGNLAYADSTYVVGTIESFDVGAFSRIRGYSGNGANIKALELKVPVLGHSGNQLMLDIDARITGSGSYDLGYECLNYVDMGDGFVESIPSRGLGLDCATERVKPDDEFFLKSS